MFIACNSQLQESDATMNKFQFYNFSFYSLVDNYFLEVDFIYL